MSYWAGVVKNFFASSLAGSPVGAHPDQGENDDLPGRHALRDYPLRQGFCVRAPTAMTHRPCWNRGRFFEVCAPSRPGRAIPRSVVPSRAIISAIVGCFDPYLPVWLEKLNVSLGSFSANVVLRGLLLKLHTEGHIVLPPSRMVPTWLRGPRKPPAKIEADDSPCHIPLAELAHFSLYKEEHGR